VSVAQLTPHASLTSDNVDPIEPRLEFVGISPFDVSPIVTSSPRSITKIKIGLVVVGKDDLVGSVDQIFQIFGQSPPVNHIICLNRKVYLLIRPVDHLL